MGHIDRRELALFEQLAPGSSQPALQNWLCLYRTSHPLRRGTLQIGFVWRTRPLWRVAASRPPALAMVLPASPRQIGFVFSGTIPAHSSPNPRVEPQLTSISASGKLGLFRTICPLPGTCPRCLLPPNWVCFAQWVAASRPLAMVFPASWRQIGFVCSSRRPSPMMDPPNWVCLFAEAKGSNSYYAGQIPVFSRGGAEALGGRDRCCPADLCGSASLREVFFLRPPPPAAARL